jgi:hypothetical protein
MKSPTLAVRTALVQKLKDSVTYTGTKIPTYEAYVQETPANRIARLTIGNEEVLAYIILLNQTSNDISPKCLRNDSTTIQVQVTTVWPNDKGGSRTAEEISELVTDVLFTDDGLFSKLELPEPLDTWMGLLRSSDNIYYDTETNRVWITQLMLSYEVSQS